LGTIKNEKGGMMPLWLAVVLSLFAVCAIRNFAFRGTNDSAFMIDIILVIVFTILLKGC
jgi:hypothetical protein